MEKQSLHPKYVPSFGRFILYVIALFIVWKIWIWYQINTQMPNIKKTAMEMALLDTTPTRKLLYEIKYHEDSICPKKIDNATVLDSVSILGNDTLRYNYSLALNKVRYNTNKLKALLGKQILAGLDLTEFKKKNVTLIYNYNDSIGNFWFNEILSPSNNYSPE
jgi:hypothetical protein